MKKVLIICLLLVYGATSFGFTLNLHYCCGELQEVSLFKNDHDCMPGMPAMATVKKQCCADEQLSVKMQADQAPSFHAVKFIKFAQQLPEYFLPEFAVFNPQQKFFVSAQPHAPPGGGIPLFIQHCVFRV